MPLCSSEDDYKKKFSDLSKALEDENYEDQIFEILKLFNPDIQRDDYWFNTDLMQEIIKIFYGEAYDKEKKKMPEVSEDTEGQSAVSDGE